MLSLEKIKEVFDTVSLDDLITNYNRRQREACNQDDEQFCNFLTALNKELSKKIVMPFYPNLMHSIIENISKKHYDENLIVFLDTLLELSKPKTTDRDILTSLKFQMEQAMNPSFNELSYERKFEIMFYIIFGHFDLKVQRQFLKLLKKYNFNSSLDLLYLMTYISSFHDEKINLEELEKHLTALSSVQAIEEITSSQIVIKTSYGSIPLSFASEILGIDDKYWLSLGKCHFAVSKYLKKFPNLYGGYYYIPNYFKGFIEHSVLVDYDKNYVYDLSHNIALPLDYFCEYYHNPSFIISSNDFNELSSLVKQDYGFTLAMHHIEEARRQQKNI